MAEAKQTKQAFSEALKELLKTQPFEKVTVSNICKQANMKRTSFYYHFLDKYDLVNWIFDTEFEAFVRTSMGIDMSEQREPPEGLTAWELVRTTAQYFEQNIGFYQKVIDFTGQNSFLDHSRELLEPLLKLLLRDQLRERNDIDFHINFYSDAILAALIRWVDDPKRVDPDELVRLLQSCLQVSAEYLDTDFGRIS